MTELIEEFKGKVQACEVSSILVKCNGKCNVAVVQHKGAQMDLLEEYLTKLHNTALK